jgi:ferrous iron transport protein B
MNSPSVVLAGLESAGKSALFRGLTGLSTGDEANFRGSTVVCRRCHLRECKCDVVDTPGIRLKDDARTTRDALSAMREADSVLLVARGTHAVSEVETLLRELNLEGRRGALVITFADKAPVEIETLADIYRRRLGIPVVVVNARTLDAASRQEVLDAIRAASVVRREESVAPPGATVVQPSLTMFERPVIGPLLSLAWMILMFALPVLAAYHFASWAQPLADMAFISPLKAALDWLPALPKTLLTGGYGVITLGWYSFLWAFPVVFLIGASVAITEETGIKDRITSALDPWMRHIGLCGRDLIPVLTGFGCNVVAVLQSRSCSACTRASCVSMIGFGSACSYQIGASLSIFSASGHPGLFLPYLFLLFVVGAFHTRFWHGALHGGAAQPLHERSFLQAPSPRAVWWRMRASMGQFLFQAMPVFILICLVAALLEHTHVMTLVSSMTAWALGPVCLPDSVAPGIVLSILRKDGLLVLNAEGGSMLAALSSTQVFVLVWLAGTCTACLVTLWTVRRELGTRVAALVAGRQMITSALTAWLIALLFA